MANDPFAAFNAFETPQSEQADPAQALNHAGGYTFTTTSNERLVRFLVLGTWGGTYYQGEVEITKESVDEVIKMINADGRAVVDTLLDVSLNGRAYKQNPTLFTLALAASAKDDAVRQYALANVNKVCRTGTMFFTFLNYAEKYRGWGSGLQKAAQRWYTDRTPDQLANQLVKYRSRGGWTHRDVLRLAKPRIAADNPLASSIRWAVDKPVDDLQLPALIEGFTLAQKATTASQWVELIAKYELPWEALPTQALNEPAVWEALVPHLGLTALLRNLGKMGASGALVHHSNTAKLVNARLTDASAYKAARVHPMQVLLSACVYGAGHGIKGSNTWTPVPTVIDNLNEGFYAAFGSLPATDKRRIIALDVSSSMGWGAIAGTFMTPAMATAALSLVALHQDPDSCVFGFTKEFIPLGLSKGMRLDSAIKEVVRNNFGATDCAKPMMYALDKKIPADSFEVYTDNETWAGHTHPHQALVKYRKEMGINSKFIVTAMTATNCTIADPNDMGSLNVVGFDASSPQMVSDFICQ